MPTATKTPSFLKQHKFALGAVFSLLLSIGGFELWAKVPKAANWAYVGPICLIICLVLIELFENKREKQMGERIKTVLFYFIAVVIVFFLLEYLFVGFFFSQI